MARRAKYRKAKYGECPVCWASHGCRKPNGHLGSHICTCGEAIDNHGVTRDGYTPSVFLAPNVKVRIVNDPRRRDIK